MRTFEIWSVLTYPLAVLLAVGVLFAITVVPGNSADLFPSATPNDLARIVRCAWNGPLQP